MKPLPFLLAAATLTLAGCNHDQGRVDAALPPPLPAAEPVAALPQPPPAPAKAAAPDPEPTPQELAAWNAKVPK
jgi:hypothetical protein